MPTPMYLRRLSRPSAPTCRGGASSLLRLAQTGSRGGDFSAWMQHAASLIAPATPWSQGEAAPSIITKLAPSQQLATR